MGYPTKTKQFGDFVWMESFDDNDILEAKEVLYQQYLHTKEHLERDGDKVFCHLEEPEWIIKKPIVFDPLNQTGSVGWKCFGTGRSFYMDSLERYGRIYKKHPNKKVVPKRKRGKANFKRYEMGLKPIPKAVRSV